jgi:hypothetical protein
LPVKGFYQPYRQKDPSMIIPVTEY